MAYFYSRHQLRFYSTRTRHVTASTMACGPGGACHTTQCPHPCNPPCGWLGQTVAAVPWAAGQEAIGGKKYPSACEACAPETGFRFEGEGWVGGTGHMSGLHTIRTRGTARTQRSNAAHRQHDGRCSTGPRAPTKCVLANVSLIVYRLPTNICLTKASSRFGWCQSGWMHGPCRGNLLGEPR